MMNWVPNEAKVKSKMLSATYVKAMKSKFDALGGGVFIVIEGGSVAGLHRNDVEKSILDRCTVK